MGLFCLFKCFSISKVAFVTTFINSKSSFISTKSTNRLLLISFRIFISKPFVFLCSWMFIFDHSKKKLSIKFIFNLIAKLLVIYLISSTLYIISNFVSSSTFFLEFNAFQRDFFLTFAKVILAPLSLLTNYVLTFIIIEKLFKG